MTFVVVGQIAHHWKDVEKTIPTLVVLVGFDI